MSMGRPWDVQGCSWDVQGKRGASFLSFPYMGLRRVSLLSFRLFVFSALLFLSPWRTNTRPVVARLKRRGRGFATGEIGDSSVCACGPRVVCVRELLIVPSVPAAPGSCVCGNFWLRLCLRSQSRLRAGTSFRLCLRVPWGHVKWDHVQCGTGRPHILVLRGGACVAFPLAFPGLAWVGATRVASSVLGKFLVMPWDGGAANFNFSRRRPARVSLSFS